MRFSAIDFIPLVVLQCQQERRDRCNGHGSTSEILCLEIWPLSYCVGGGYFFFIAEMMPKITTANRCKTANMISSSVMLSPPFGDVPGRSSRSSLADTDIIAHTQSVCQAPFAKFSEIIFEALGSCRIRQQPGALFIHISLMSICNQVEKVPSFQLITTKRTTKPLLFDILKGVGVRELNSNIQ